MFMYKTLYRVSINALEINIEMSTVSKDENFYNDWRILEFASKNVFTINDGEKLITECLFNVCPQGEEGTYVVTIFHNANGKTVEWHGLNELKIK